MAEHKMEPQAKAEYVIEGIAGCGCFQVAFFIAIVLIIKSVTAYSIMFMSFGNYNPGWRCLDNSTVSDSIGVNGTEHTIGKVNGSSGYHERDYDIASCDDYRKCYDVEFNPETATIVTEWGLVCDRSWIVSLIISIQMLGMLIGAYFGGQLADLIGRKKTLCIGIIVCSISHLISSFSVSWVMFLLFRFALGVSASSDLVIMFLYMSEYMTKKWRAISVAVPLWYIGSTFLALTAWIVKDWRKVEIGGCVLSAACLIPLLTFGSESLRWLEANNKRKEFITISKKILKMNKKAEISFEDLDLSKTDTNEKKEIKRYNLFDLFRKGYRVTTICIMFLHFAFSVLYYAISFGAKSFYGNFYFNLFVMNVIPVPFGLFSMLLMRVLSRRWHTLSFLLFTVLCSVVSVAILIWGNEAAKDFGSSVLISVSKATLDAGWIGVYGRNAELYPTVVRGVAVGVGSMAARVGGIVAPFLVPKDKSVLYIFMIGMSAVTIVCCLVSLKLPETKDKVLKQTFDDKGDGDESKNKVENELQVM